MKYIILSVLMLFSYFAAAQHIEDNPARLDSLLRAHKNMHFYQSPTLGRSDSVWNAAEHRYLYFDTDSICRQFIRKGGYNAVSDEMYHLYSYVFNELTPEKRTLEIAKMEKIAKKYHSDDLMHEVEFQKIFILPHDSKEQSKYRFESFRKLQHQAEIRKDIKVQIRIRDDILRTFYYENHIFEAFEEAMEMLHILDNITDEQFVGRQGIYFFIGELYYIYGYNEQAIPLFKKALKNAEYFFDRSNLRARNDLGLYYREKGDFDTSDQYFRSMLESPDQVQWRGEYDAIAICNLGKNYLLRKEYKKAEMLLQKGLPVMARFDPVFTLGIYISLGDCYLTQGNLPQAKAMIDFAQKNINIYPSWGPPNIDFYPLLSKYYAAVGNVKASAAYMDSTVRQQNEYRDKYNVSKIFQVERKLNEAEKKVEKERLTAEKLQKNLFRTLFISLLILIAITVIFYLFYVRMRKQKNRILYKRMMEERPATIHKNALLQRLEELMQTEQLFTNPDISRQEVANRLSTNETYLINAIKDGYSGQTFSDFINSSRLIFARKLLIETDNSIKKISIESGFSSYKYFHQLFYEKIGMSPSDFRSVANE